MRIIIIFLLLITTQFLIAEDIAYNGDEQDSLEMLLNTSVSTASKYEQNIFDAPASVTVVTADDIKQFGYKTLADVLNNEAGFFLTNDRNYTYLGTRGFQLPDAYNNKIVLLIDGHTVNDAVYGSGYVNNEYIIDLAMIEKIEIVRGPGSVLYGTSAMFAVINVITKDAKRIDGLHINAGGGSYNYYQGSFVFGKEFKEGKNISMGMCFAKDDGRDFHFSEYDSTIYKGNANGNDNSKVFGGYLSANLDEFKLSAYYSRQTKYVPTAKYGTDFMDKNFRETDERSFVELGYKDSYFSILNINGRAFFDHYNFDGYYPIAGNIGYETNQANTLGFEIQTIWDLYSNNRLTAGVEYSNNFKCDYEKMSGDVRDFYVNKPYSLVALYLNNNYQIFDDLALSLGFSEDIYSNNIKAFNPRISLVYSSYETTSIKLLFGKAFRRPNIYETEYYDELSQLKSNNLKPEEIITQEIVWEQMIIKNLKLSASVYHYEIDKIIENTPVTDKLFEYKNFTECNSWGTDLGFKYYINNLNAYLIYSYNKTTKENADLIVSYPESMVKWGLSWQFLEEFTASATCVYETGRYTRPDLPKTDPFLLTNVYFAYEPKFGEDSDMLYNNMTLSLNLNNIFDTQYYHPTGLENRMYQILQNGFNFCLNLSIKVF